MPSLFRYLALSISMLISLKITTVIAGHVDPEPLSDELVQKLVRPQLSTRPQINVSERLNRHLATLSDLTQTEQKRDAASARMLSATQRIELTQLRDQINDELTKTRQQYQRLGLTDKVKMTEAFQSQVATRFHQLDKLLGEVDVAEKTSRHTALTKLSAEINTLRGGKLKQQTHLYTAPKPTFRHIKLPAANAVQPSKELPRYLATQTFSNNMYASLGDILVAAAPVTPPEAASCGYTAADLAATADAPQSADIQSLAATLNYSPAKIFQFVANNIQFQPYYGSLKGASATLLSRSGGPTDQASLLIALLRASNIPARYVRGTVQLLDATPDLLGGRAGRWVGAKSYNAAAAILNNGMFSAIPFTIGVQFHHVWVEACVPYGHYRGAAVDNTGERWIPLDPSIKDKTYQAGIPTSVSFDYSSTGYLAARTNGPDSLPQEKYAQQVESVLRSTSPSATIADARYIGELIPLTLDILPATLPFEVISFTNWSGTTSPEIAQLPADHRYRFSIGGLGLASNYNLYMPDISLARVTLAYKGATTSDQTALSTWRNDNNLNSAIPCTINVVPALRVDGIDKGITGSTVGLCSSFNALSMSVYLDEISTTFALNAINYTNIGAANLHALQAYAFQGSNAVIAQHAAKLLTNVNANPNPNATDSTLDSTEGEYLNLVGLKYLRYVSDAQKLVGGIDGGSGEPGYHLGLASTQSKIQYVFDQPYAVSRTGFLVDMPGLLDSNVDLTTGTEVWNTFRLTSYAASAYESYIWQENAHLDAVSTVRGLQFANEPAQAIGMVTLTSANWATVRPTLTVYPGATAEDCTSSATTLQYPRCLIDSATSGVLSFVNLGYSVTLPKSLIQYGNWRGYVYASERSTQNTADLDCPGVFCATFAISKVP